MAFTTDDIVVATGPTTTKTKTAAQILTWLAGALAAANLIVAGITSSGPITAPSVATTVLTVTSDANITGTCTAGYFSGNGAGLTGLPAPSSVPDSALSSNVPVMTNGVLPAVSGALLTNLPAPVVDVARTWTTTQTFAPIPADDGVLHTDPFYYSAQPVTLMSPEFDFAQPVDITNSITAGHKFTVAVNNNTMTVVTDPSGTLPHKLAIGQWVQFRNGSTCTGAWTWLSGWSVNTFLDGKDVTGGTTATTWANNVVTIGTGSAHGLTAGNYVAFGATDMGDSAANSPYLILSTPTDHSLTLALRSEETSDFEGTNMVLFTAVQVKTIPTPCSFTCDFIHGNQAATEETGALAHIYNAGFCLPMPAHTLFCPQSIGLIISARPGAATGYIVCNTAPAVDIGGGGIMTGTSDGVGHYGSLSEACAKAWTPWTTTALTSWRASIGQTSPLRVSVQYEDSNVPAYGVMPNGISYPTLQARLNTAGDFGTDVVKGRFVISGFAFKVQ